MMCGVDSDICRSMRENDGPVLPITLRHLAQWKVLMIVCLRGNILCLHDSVNLLTIVNDFNVDSSFFFFFYFLLVICLSYAHLYQTSVGSRICRSVKKWEARVLAVRLAFCGIIWVRVDLGNERVSMIAISQLTAGAVVTYMSTAFDGLCVWPFCGLMTVTS